MPELAAIGSIPAANGRSAWRDREVWMHSEPRRPQIILSYIEGHVVKSAPQITIPSCGPARLACLPEAFSFARGSALPSPLGRTDTRSLR